MGKTDSKLEFLFHADVQKIFNNFTDLFRIRIAFYDPEGRELKVGKNLGNSPYCRLLRSCPKGESDCVAEDRRARETAGRKQDVHVYTCHGGLVEAVKPIIQDARCIGYAMIGQVRTQPEPPESWIESAAVGNLEEGVRVLLNAYRDISYHPHTELLKIIEFFSILMDLISSRNMICIKGLDNLTELMSEFREDPHRILPLREAAEKVFLSPSRLSHLVKERYGTSYTTLVRELRINHAKQLLVYHQHLSIKEAAYAAGFTDPQYFSKVFRQDVGMSPSDFRIQQNFPQ